MAQFMKVLNDIERSKKAEESPVNKRGNTANYKEKSNK